MIRTRTAIAAFIAILVLAAVIAWGARSWRRFREGLDAASVSDTVQMIVFKVRDLIREKPDPTDQELREVLKVLDEASICHLWYDTRGGIVDVWGTPFLIDWKRGFPDSPVTVKSAGPDRAMGTADDIVFTTRR